MKDTTKKTSASGSATNAGIEFQQRVAACFLASMLLDFDVSDILGIPNINTIGQISFETSESIDDLKVSCEGNLNILFQVKRGINLSSLKKSPFYKTIDQFIRQYLNKSAEEEVYVLATSTDASARVGRELKKILESIRLNDQNFVQNPLNRSEKSVSQIYRNVVREVFRKYAKRNMTEQEFLDFTRRVYVAIFDVEQGQPLEKAIMLLLNNIALVNPNLIWAILIKNALSYTTQRVSINKIGLKRILQKYLISEKESKTDQSITEEAIRVSATMSGSISSGKEVLLIEPLKEMLSVKPFTEDIDCLIIELFRFNEDCSRRLKFNKDKCILLDGSEVRVLFRAATFEGTQQYLGENKALIEGKKIGIIGARGIDDVESSLCAKTHAAFCEHLLESNASLLKCLHCGKIISEATSLLVEVDEDGIKPTVGLVHNVCLRPLNRVLGRPLPEQFKRFDYLKRFDADLWFKSIKNGQRAFNEFKSSTFPSLITLAWNPNIEYGADYDYCVRIDLEDGSCVYVTRRGKVERLTHSTALEYAVKMNSGIRSANQKNDPFCYTSKKKVFGLYSMLLKIKEEDETCLRCVSAESEKYSDLIGKSYDVSSNFYAPLCLLVDLDSEEEFSIENYIVFLSDPIMLEQYKENWEKAGLVPDNYGVKIIENDMRFDNKMHNLQKRGKEAVVDPLLDQNGNLVKGFIIKNFDDLMRAAPNNSFNASGD